jgi:chaperone BCS1
MAQVPMAETKVSATFSQGDQVYEWVMHYLVRSPPLWITSTDGLQTEEGLWKRTKDFDVSLKSTRRKWAVSMFDQSGTKQSADYVPKWIRPVLFRWQGYWVDVVRSDGGSTPPWGTNGGEKVKLQ